MLLSKERIMKALIRLRPAQAGLRSCCLQASKASFLTLRPIMIKSKSHIYIFCFCPTWSHFILGRTQPSLCLKDQKCVFKTNYCLMQIKSIAECSKGSESAILLTVIKLPFVIKILFCLFLSVRFRVKYELTKLMENKVDFDQPASLKG